MGIEIGVKGVGIEAQLVLLVRLSWTSHLRSLESLDAEGDR